MNNERLNRRTFLGAVAASGIALGLGQNWDWVLAATVSKPKSPFADEAARLTAATMGLFWDNHSHMFRAPVLSSETVPSDADHDRGYTLWASLLGLHALVEGEKAFPGTYTAQIAMVYDGLEQYFNSEISAYTAWLHFPGNADAYYDDNSWVVIIITEAALACKATDSARAAQYLERAGKVMKEYVIHGWDATGQPGGVHWGSDPAKPDTSDRGTSSTAGAALAAMVLAGAGVETEFYTKWGHDVLTWLTDKLLDKDGLIMDALTPPDWKQRRVKWTYNTGVPLRAYVEHFRLTTDASSLEMATRLAKAALNHNGALFDLNAKDPAKRYYRDGIYFVHYLIDGLLQFSQVTPDKKLAAAVTVEGKRSARYAQSFLKDPIDGFYWRNWRLYTIGPGQLGVWQRWTGQTISPQYDASERSQEAKYATLSVEKRPLVKTLLANGGAARLFWLAARFPVEGTLAPVKVKARR